MILVVRCNNGSVTDKYLDIIAESLNKSLNEPVYEINNVKNVKKFKKNDFLVVARLVDAFYLIVMGYKNIIMWFQGVEPEESYMKHKSIIRLKILNKMEKIALKKCKFCFFVSKAMLDHYKKKYNYNKTNYYCMPCLNTDIHKSSFFKEGKYENNHFAYVGSMETWQKFEETARCYKKIEDTGIKNCKFFVFTGDKDKACEILKKVGVDNYKIDFLKGDELTNALSSIKYGFIIREDSVVNNVSTPTKISTYLSCGMIPIFSECIYDFNEISQKMKYVVKYDSNFLNKIAQFNDMKISANDIYSEYENVFNTYYNINKHKNNITRQFNKILKECD